MWGVQLTHVAAGTGTYITLNMLIFSRFTVRISRSINRIARQVAPDAPCGVYARLPAHGLGLPDAHDN